MSTPGESARGDPTFITGGGIKEHRDTRMHRKADEVARMDKQLSKVKEDCGDRVRELREKEEEFLERQKRTMESMDKFKAYIFDSDRKRRQSERRLAERRKVRKDADDQIKELQENLRKLKVTRSRLDESLGNLECYEDYLDDLLAESSAKTKDEMIARFALLKETRRVSVERSAKAEHEIMKIQRDTNKLDKDMTNEILVGKGQMVKLREAIEEAANKNSNSTEEQENKALKRNRMLKNVAAIRNAIFTLHVQAMNSYPVPKKAEAFDPDPEKLQSATKRERTDVFFDHMKLHLEKLRERMVELREIVPKSMIDAPDAMFLGRKQNHKGGKKGRRKGRGRVHAATVRTATTMGSSRGSPMRSAAQTMVASSTFRSMRS
uniref:DUF4200 domain-containing protein n=1 Tax=Lotharella globosa TaxID=91324 RepID=A0A7S3YCB6_9EUKA|mmetsp:Transcript_2886/g.5715  ORF Transcript_2886/g.5715 Transcript_2886/m.5715 type:complete len:379 (-) Transcript_2886:53-1189(-)